jgi:hypothetical protein
MNRHSHSDLRSSARIRVSTSVMEIRRHDRIEAATARKSPESQEWTERPLTAV